MRDNTNDSIATLANIVARSEPTRASELETSLLLDLVRGFHTNPVLARRSMRELLQRNASRFFAAALTVLRQVSTGQGHDFLLGVLQENQLLVSALADPGAMQLGSAVELARYWARVDARLDAQLLQYAVGGSESSTNIERLHRTLAVLDEVSDCARLVPLLMKLIAHSDPQIRSKAAKLLARTHRNAEWLTGKLADEDNRLRANLIEGLLKRKPSEKETAALWGLATDSHHRVATTALLVLFKAGLEDDAALTLEQLVEHPEEQFRVAALWAMGQTGDKRFLPLATELARKGEGKVRGMAIRTAGLIRRAKPEKAAPPQAESPVEPAAVAPADGLENAGDTSIS